jgi:hypothetical protein
MVARESEILSGSKACGMADSPKSAKKKRLVFLSHSGQDMWVARQIAEAMEACGAQVFLDEAHIAVGSAFEEDIIAALRRAHELVVLVTPWALTRSYVIAELGAAWIRKIPIVILLHGLTAVEFQSKPNVPVFLKEKNLLDLNEIDKYLKELRTRSSK